MEERLCVREGRKIAVKFCLAQTSFPEILGGVTFELVRANSCDVREASQLGLEACCQVSCGGAKRKIDIDKPLDMISGMQMLSRER